MESELNNIMVCTDFSIRANNALEAGLAIAHQHNCKLYLVHIIPTDLLPNDTSEEVIDTSIIEDLGLKSFVELNKLKESINSKNHLEIEVIVKFGSLGDSIKELAVQNSVHLIIIGRGGVFEKGKSSIGSNALSIINQSEIPVLCIPTYFTKRTFENILYPIWAFQLSAEKQNLVRSISDLNNFQIHFLGLNEIDNKDNLVSLDNSMDNFTRTNYSFEEISVNNFSETILNVSRKRETDLLVLNFSNDVKSTPYFEAQYLHILNYAKLPLLLINKRNEMEDLNDELLYLVAEANYVNRLYLNIQR